MNIISNKEHWLFEQSKIRGDKKFIISNESSYSYSQFFNLSLQAANSFIKKGLKQGDRVAIYAEHNSDFILATFALWLIGAIPVPLNTKNSVDILSDQIIFTGSKFFVTKKSNSLIDTDSIKLTTIPIDELKENTSKVDNGIITKFSLQDYALIMFTSGSSGKPKAVQHTFNSLFASVALTDSFSELSLENSWLASLPFYHIGGFMIMVRVLLSGSVLVIPQSTNYLGLQNALTEFKPTHISLVTTTLKQFLENELAPNLNLKEVYLGGGPSNQELILNAIEKGFPITKVYGSTETCSMITALSKKDLLAKPESVGFPLGGTEIKIADESGRFLGPFQVGEVVVKSNTLMKEYLNNFEETSTKLKNGFYFTGDYGWLDNEGFLFIELRREDLIITGGENVSPKEIEQYIIQLPSVRDVYVFPETDSKWGQIICAAIVSQIEITENEIKNQLKNMMAPFKVPKKIYFVNRIPRNEIGKIQKEELKKLLY
jgi:O-succinylbenzoic acid--CoA ligase